MICYGAQSKSTNALSSTFSNMTVRWKIRTGRDGSIAAGALEKRMFLLFLLVFVMRPCHMGESVGWVHGLAMYKYNSGCAFGAGHSVF